MITKTRANEILLQLQSYCEDRKVIEIEGRASTPTFQQIYEAMGRHNVFVASKNRTDILLVGNSVRIEDYPNDDILLFDKDFNLIDFCPRESNAMIAKMMEIESFAGDRRQQERRISQMMRSIGGSPLGRLRLFSPNHNLKWLEEAK